MRGDPWFLSLMLSPPLICGRRLLPFSAAHLVILGGIESPYVTGADPQPEDLLLAIQICSRTLEENAAYLSGKHGIRASARWAWRWRAMNFAIADASFRTYLIDSRRGPDSKKGEDAASKIVCPLPWHLVRVLMQIYRFTESEAWNMALGKALCYFYTWAESKGDDSIKTQEESDQDAQVIEWMTEAYAAHDAGEYDKENAIYAKVQGYINEKKAKPDK